MHTNYRLTYCTKNSVWKTYFGETEVYATQTPQEACDVRLEWHLQYPKACMDGGVQDTFEIKPYGKLLSHRNALCQEAIDTAVGLETESIVRGVCFSKRVLTVMLEGCAAQLRKTTKNMTGQAARNAVFKYAQTLDETHPLVCHLEHKSYYEKKPERPAKLVQKRSGRSGKPGGETRERQLERGEYKHGDKTHRRLQRGQNVSKRILKSNENRKTPRKSGSRKKHKQSLTLALTRSCSRTATLLVATSIARLSLPAAQYSKFISPNYFLVITYSIAYSIAYIVFYNYLIGLACSKRK